MSLKLPATPSVSASTVMPLLSPAAAATAETVVQEIIDATMPQLSTFAWAWYNAQSTGGFFGWCEHSLLGPIFTALFGANPGVTTTPATVAAPADGAVAGS